MRMGRWGWVLGGLVACGYETNVSRLEDAPTASILSPSDDSVVAAGRLEMLGRVQDAVDDADRLFVVWSLGDAQAIATGGWRDACSGFAEADGTTRCTVQVGVDDARIRLRVKDVAGFEGTATASIGVREVALPIITWDAPTDADAPLYANVPVPVQVHISDADDDLASLDITWQSDVLGRIDGPDVPDVGGTLRGALLLPEGGHTLTLTVEDPDGGRAVAQQIVEIRPDNLPPEVRVDGPADGAGLRVGEPVLLMGRTWDDVTAPDALEVTWRSDVDGVLATPTPDALGHVDVEVPALSSGPHTLTLSSVDDADAPGERSVQVVVDQPPGLVVLTPEDGATVGIGAYVLWEAALTDLATPGEALTLRVQSDVEGLLFEAGAAEDGGVVRSLALQQPGEHQLTWTATDAYGLQTIVTTTVTVGAAP